MSYRNQALHLYYQRLYFKDWLLSVSVLDTNLCWAIWVSTHISRRAITSLASHPENNHDNRAAKTAGAARKTIGLALSSWALHREMITHLTLAAL